MQKAEHILQAIHKLGVKRAPLTRVYRALFSEDLFLAAYDKIGRNEGALTPGTEDDTVDGMSLRTIRNIIEKLRCERFRFRPSRRSQAPKKSGGTRPLGVPNFPEKLVQEALRMILEAYYEPRFKECSHGFRPNRGCHTALATIKQKFKGTAWFIEGDIRGCFDNIDHQVLMDILSRDIHDGRFLNLIRMGLEAGYVEDWEYHRTYSGTPQGGILSPLLANIYLHELDKFIEETLIPRFTSGKRRADNPEYWHMSNQIDSARKKGNEATVHALEKERRNVPSQDTHDPNSRRLRYIRYADDFLLGFAGPKSEAEIVKAAIGEFLKDKLNLEMSGAKTLITHARTERARFLGYDISIYHADDRLSSRKESPSKIRAINGVIRLGVPFGLTDEMAKRYQRNGKPIHQPGIQFHSDAHIVNLYQRRYLGIAQYYKYAVDRYRFGKLKYVMEVSLTKTLASKFRTTVANIYKRYKGTRTMNGYTYKTLEVKIPTDSDTGHVYWGAVSLKTIQPGTEAIEDTQYSARTNATSDLIQRLQADRCELCGSQENCEVHHVRKLANLKQRWQGRKEKPEWVKRMIRMQRKTLVVCHKCHANIHAGRPTPKQRK